MNARTIQPLTAVGIAAVLTAATITTAGIHTTNVSTGLRTDFTAVQLQALAVSAATTAPAAAEAPAAALTPAAAATAAASTDPIQVVTDAVRNVLSIAAAAVWFAAFPITLPLSVIGGLLMNVAQSVNSTQAPAAADPLLGLSFFFTAPNILLTTGLANFGLTTNVIQQQHMQIPIGMAAAVRPAAATKRVATAPTAPAASAASPRSAKSVVGAAKSGSKAAKRTAAARSR